MKKAKKRPYRKMDYSKLKPLPMPKNGSLTLARYTRIFSPSEIEKMVERFRVKKRLDYPADIPVHPSLKIEPKVVVKSVQRILARRFGKGKVHSFNHEDKTANLLGWRYQWQSR